MAPPGSGAAMGDGAARGDDCPVVVLVGPDDDPWTVAKVVRRADAAVPWPAGHDDLEEVVAQLLGRSAAPDAGSSHDRAGGGLEGLVVGGACGGVGTTTVAITLAAARVWERHGGRALAITSGPTPVPDVRSVDRDVVAGHRAWAAGADVPGVPGLRVVRSRVPAGRIRGPDDVAIVVDVGVVDPAGQEVDVLVVRRDAAGLAAVARAACHTVVVADVGPVPRTRLVQACAGRRVVVAPWSVRVARAHALGRVPGSLPGSYTAVFTGTG